MVIATNIAIISTATVISIRVNPLLERLKFLLHYFYKLYKELKKTSYHHLPLQKFLSVLAFINLAQILGLGNKKP